MGIVGYMEGGTLGCGTLRVERKLFGNANLTLNITLIISLYLGYPSV